MTTRTVTDTILHPDGTPWETGAVSFLLIKGSYTGSAAYPKDTVSLTTDSDGTYTATLWCDEEGVIATRYKATYPSGETFSFDLPTGSSPVAMSSLRAVTPYVATSNLDTLLAAHTAAPDPHPQYLTQTEAVTSVNGATGVVVLSAADVDADASGTASALVAAEASARASADTTNASATSTHTSSTSNPHSVTAAQTGAYTTSQADTLLAAKAPLASPTFTGTPAAPTAAAATNSTQLATTAFVQAAVAALINSAPGALDTLGELAAQLATDESGVAALTTTVAGKLAAASNLSDLTNAGTARSNLGLGALATLASVTASLISDASPNGRSLITAANYSAMRTLLGLGSAALSASTAFEAAGTVATEASARTAADALLATKVARGRSVVAGTTHYSLPGVAASTSGTVAISANIVRYQPIIVDTPITIDQLALEVTTAGAASSTARMGLYAADTSWQPTTLVVDAGTVAVDSTGVKTATINQALDPGRYLLALNSNGAPTLRTIRGSIANAIILATIGASPLAVSLRGTQTYGAFPGTGAAIDTVTASTVGIEYLVLLRVSTP